jgi:hypothetical protein
LIKQFRPPSLAADLALWQDCGSTSGLKALHPQ